MKPSAITALVLATVWAWLSLGLASRRVIELHQQIDALIMTDHADGNGCIGPEFFLTRVV